MLASTDPGLASTGSAIVSAAGCAHVRGAGTALPFLRARGRTGFADCRAQARLIRTGPQAPRLLSHSFTWRIRPQFRKVCSFHSPCPPGDSASGPRRPRLERGGHGAGAGTTALFPHSARAPSSPTVRGRAQSAHQGARTAAHQAQHPRPDNHPGQGPHPDGLKRVRTRFSPSRVSSADKGRAPGPRAHCPAATAAGSGVAAASPAPSSPSSGSKPRICGPVDARRRIAARL